MPTKNKKLLETFDSNCRVINDTEDFNNVFVYFDWMVNSKLRTIICGIIEKGGYALVKSSINPEESLWDGLLTIHYATPPSAQETVKLINAAGADEFGMEDDKTLYLWWD
jgi:hypothetical protein